MTPQERREALKQELRAYRIEAINGLDEYTDGGLADRALVLAEPWLAVARADERRRTADEIKRRIHVLFADRFGIQPTALARIFSICDEVGGNDE